MFAELYAVAKHTPLHISVSPDGARLNVLIVPKPGDDAKEGSALAQPIQAIGTPEELDRELPAKLAEYCAAINDLRLKIDLPIEAITAEAGRGGGTNKKASTPPRTPARPSAPKPKKKVQVKLAKPIKQTESGEARKKRLANEARRALRAREIGNAKTEQKTAAAQGTTPDTKGGVPRTGDSTPGTITSGNERPSGGLSPESPASAAAPAAESKKSKRATREECIADLRAYLAQCESSNITITRALFLANNMTGRSYERKFKSWDEFIAEARKAPGDETKGPPADASAPAFDTKPAEGETDAGAGVQPAKETPSRTALNPALKWPFPDATKPIEAAKPLSHVIYTEEGKLLGATLDELHIHDCYVHPQFGSFRVVSVVIDGDLSRRITVSPWFEAATAAGPAADPLPPESGPAKPRLKHTPNGPVPAEANGAAAAPNTTLPLFPE